MCSVALLLASRSSSASRTARHPDLHLSLQPRLPAPPPFLELRTLEPGPKLLHELDLERNPARFQSPTIEPLSARERRHVRRVHRQQAQVLGERVEHLSPERRRNSRERRAR